MQAYLSGKKYMHETFQIIVPVLFSSIDVLKTVNKWSYK